MLYRKKPIIIEAHFYDGDGFEALEWASQVSDGAGTYLSVILGEGLIINTLEGKMQVRPGDWIVCGVEGEFYPVRNDIFKQTYEYVGESND